MRAPTSRAMVPLIACPATCRPVAIHGNVDPAHFMSADLHGFVIDCEHCGGVHEYDAADVFFDPADAPRFSSLAVTQ
jgi:hypothetical protein